MKLVPFIILMTFLLECNSLAEKQRSTRDDEQSSGTTSRCYDEIGCIETDSRWYDKKIRPVNLKPLDRHIIKTDFLLIKLNEEKTRAAGDLLLYNNMMAKYESILSAGFSRNSEVIILIHDFTSNGYTGWIKHFAVILLKKVPHMNVISVDWQRGSEPPYDQAISNGRVVALEILALLRELKDGLDLKLCNVHIVGHGIGAHIAGYVGTTYNTIKKITGLDPSGPRFEGMPDIVKLNPSCAKYVEVIHTDAFDSRSQGTKENMGHSDFYINNARLQPGCPENSTFTGVTAIDRNSLHEGEIMPGCSHKRAFKYFIEAVSDVHCVFLGVKCESFDDFTKGNCISCNQSEGTCKTFGLKTYKDPVEKTSFYLNTADHYPFCMFQYKISVFVEPGKKNYHGFFDFILVDDKTNITAASLLDPISNYRNIRGGTENTYIYYAHPPRLGKITEARVRWNEKKKFYCFIYCKQIINVEKIIIRFLGTGRNDEGRQRKLCPLNDDTEIENGSYTTFVACKKHRTSTDTSETGS